MAKATRLDNPTYTLALTANEAEVLFFILGKMAGTVDEVGGVHGALNSVGVTAAKLHLSNVDNNPQRPRVDWVVG